ncbi:hypothetical protein crov133 [Cafeteria roenbergensis virus]|uniref:Protein kinase domain-containing protein n=1 Tax=Cafeteria roenbergensis virus (strain BV-PW1) TaxID=693272 RepID=E3T4Q3_CROVB|nr:hypothetical protein crov133 [Cafeteria roenbergensis virus BV-PW1]ADO67166.1 hypothetical protein crov133 [Cafeteria roenbergensis virus BV-PW1]
MSGFPSLVSAMHKPTSKPTTTTPTAGAAGPAGAAAAASSVATSTAGAAGAAAAASSVATSTAGAAGAAAASAAGVLPTIYDDGGIELFGYDLDDICKDKLTKENYQEKINKFLEKMGISIDIKKLYNILTSKFKGEVLEDELPRLALYSDYAEIKLKNTDETIIIKNIKKRTEGGYNQIYEGDSNIKNFKKIIIRTVDVKFLQNKLFIENEKILYETIYENLKHIILYIINRCNIGKQYQLVPQPLTMGYNPLTHQIMFIMEKGDYTLKDTLQNTITRIINNEDLSEQKLKIRQLIYSFYKSLSLFNEQLDYFVHGDAKYNNVIIKNDKIMLIDFGFSCFKLYDLIFDSSIKYVYHSLEHTEYNAVQDLCQMLYSFYIILDVHFTNDTNRRKLLTEFNNIINVTGSRFCGYHIFRGWAHFTKDIWKYLYKTNYQNLLWSFEPYISPDKMKIDYEIDKDDSRLYNDFYYTKYLKYKNKYLELSKLYK